MLLLPLHDPLFLAPLRDNPDTELPNQRGSKTPNWKTRKMGKDSLASTIPPILLGMVVQKVLVSSPFFLHSQVDTLTKWHGGFMILPYEAF
nr:hypothetical protein [Acidithiobacillus thiooxidans]